MPILNANTARLSAVLLLLLAALFLVALNLGGFCLCWSGVLATFRLLLSRHAIMSRLFSNPCQISMLRRFAGAW